MGENSVSKVGPARPKADGFPLAPLLEAVIDVNFRPHLTDEELKIGRSCLSSFYPTFTGTPFHEFRVDAEAAAVELVSSRVHYQGIGRDTTELSLFRPDGLGSSQLAPYREWNDLYGRFKRDLEALYSAVGKRELTRIAVRSINRIDVPPSGDLIRYEDYLTVYPHVPDDWVTIDDFQLQIVKLIKEVGATAKIIVKRHPPAADDCASFFLDIDLYRSTDLPAAGDALDALFDQFHTAKNDLYRSCLTPVALKEFEQ